jgi:hypothetical protein
MPAGYSKRSVVEKLGITKGHTLYVHTAPPSFVTVLKQLPSEVRVLDRLTRPQDIIIFFTTTYTDLIKYFAKFKEDLSMNGMLWVCWPKGSSKIPTDVNENIIREVGLDLGLVDVKVCAIDTDWSGLKFVYRTKDRS